MEQFLNIKQAIYDYFVNTEGKQYIEDIGTIYSILHSDLYIAQGGMSNVICDQERRDKRGV